MERNGKPCYANKIAPKRFVVRVITAALINMTGPSCFTKKWLLQLLKERYINTYPKEYIPRSQNFISHRVMITRQYYHK